MSQPHKIVLLGFSPFERSTFESFFRLAARRPPGYLLVSQASEANLAVVNSDDQATLKAVVQNKPCGQVMLVGSTDGGTGWSLQRRPLNLMKVLANVEQLLGGAPAAKPTAPIAPPAPIATSTPAIAAPVFSARPAASQPARAFTQFPSHVSPPIAMPSARIAPATAPAALTAASAVDRLTVQQRNSIRLGTADFTSSKSDAGVLGAPTRPMSMNDSSSAVDHIMVVDDSDIALKFMRNRLTRFGFSADLVSSGEEALGRLNVRAYKFVFLDVMMEGLDGYQTCRAIKQRKYAEGKPPVVVMLTSRGGTIDKIRGTLAGCDAYLTKPLNERDLIAVLAKHDRSVARGFQETNFGVSAKSGFGAVR